MISTVYRDYYCKHCLSLRKVIRSCLCCLFISGGMVGSALADPVYHLCGHVPSYQSGQNDCTVEKHKYGIPVFRIDQSCWFDITIDLPGHPKTAQEIEEQRNHDVLLRRSGRPDPPDFFPGANDITEGLRLRFHYSFK